jgi:biopolymer transport protein ExbD
MAQSLPEADEGADGIVAEINITPLTDVFLVLLIIFMVTSSVIQSQGKKVDLPEAAVSEITPKGVSVTVTDSGEIQVNDKVVSEEALVEELRAALEQAEEKLLILRGDKTMLYGKAVNILDLANQVGAKHIALATTKRRGTGGE